MASILLIDDDVCSLGALEHLLASDGHLVRAFARGDEAIVAIRAMKFDVILTDLEMPKPNGYDIVVAGQAQRPRPCVGVLTASLRVNRSELIALGACFVLDKPVDYDHLVATFRDCPRCRSGAGATVVDGAAHPRPPSRR